MTEALDPAELGDAERDDAGIWIYRIDRQGSVAAFKDNQVVIMYAPAGITNTPPLSDGDLAEIALGLLE
jgi:hypothetical protein